MVTHAYISDITLQCALCKGEQTENMATAAVPDIEDTEGDQDIHISRRLVSILDDYGLTKQSISNRQHAMQLWNLWFHVVQGILYNNDLTSYVSGSKAEGVSSFADEASDVDVMYILPYNIIHPAHGYNQLNHFAKNNTIFSLEDSTSHPLYKRLKYIKGPTFGRHRPFRHINGYSFLAHDCLLSDWQMDVASQYAVPPGPNHRSAHVFSSSVCGPSASFCIGYSPGWPVKYECDHVASVFCPFWPNEIDEWFVRRRHKNWPLNNDIQLIKDKGCLLVAKGVDGSAECDIEWRVSFSMAENTLIKSFNNVQMKCYFLLKKFLKTAIKQNFPKVLCSYHMKTVMFWICEEIGYSLFRNDCLFKCFILCTERIRSYLEEGHFPCYFMPTGNLLSVGVEIQKYKKLAEFLSIVSNKEIFTPFTAYLKDECSHTGILRQSKIQESDLLTQLLKPGTKHTIELYAKILTTKGAEEIPNYFMRVMSCVTRKCFFSNYPKDKCFRLLKQLLFPDFVFACVALSAKTNPRNKIYYKLQEQFFTFLTDSLAVEYSSGLLKRATVYYKTGKYSACMMLTMNIINILCERNCFNFGQHVLEKLQNKMMNIFLINNGTFKIGRSVTFSPLDRSLAPDFILKEMDFREDIEGESTYGWAFVDPLVYAYGLVIMCQHELSDFVTRGYYTQELQNVFLRRKSRICYQNSAERVIDYFRKQFRRQ